jgi:hypothetical protein
MACQGYGIIDHPSARIFDLREMGYEIRTVTRPTRWGLVSAPGAKQLTLVRSRLLLSPIKPKSASGCLPSALSPAEHLRLAYSRTPIWQLVQGAHPANLVPELTPRLAPVRSPAMFRGGRTVHVPV